MRWLKVIIVCSVAAWPMALFAGPPAPAAAAATSTYSFDLAPADAYLVRSAPPCRVCTHRQRFPNEQPGAHKGLLCVPTQGAPPSRRMRV
jgi:hypothetical protein